MSPSLARNSVIGILTASPRRPGVMAEGSLTEHPASGDVAQSGVEPPDSDYDGPTFAEMDPSGRYGRFDQVLGRGACKVVYKAFDTQEGIELAWNQVRGMEFMNNKDAENREERERIFAEVRVLKALKHKNIMSFSDSWYDPRAGTINFITELFTSGTLRQYRRRHRHTDPEVLKGWAWQILCGLVYLHGHNPPIIHRDLKCDNIFINGSDGVVKIGDLGLATLLRSRTAPQSVLGTPEFMAPELYEEEYDDRVDVYSFGMCLLELSTLEYPYAECKNAAQIYRKVSLGVRPAGLQKVPPGPLSALINLCLLPRDARPRARALLKHPFFESVRAAQGVTGAKSEAALMAMAGAPLDPSLRLSLMQGEGSLGGDRGGPASAPLSRTTSAGGAEAVSEASVLSMHSSLSEYLGAGQLADIAEEDPEAPGGEASAGGALRGAATPPHARSRQASRLPSPAPSRGGGVFSPGLASPRPLSSANSAAGSDDGRGGGNGRAAAERSPSPPSPAAQAGREPPRGRSEGTERGVATGDRTVARHRSAEERGGGKAPDDDVTDPNPIARLAPRASQSRTFSTMLAPDDGSAEAAALQHPDAGGALRRFAVVGNFRAERDEFGLRLRIAEPGGGARTVEFAFDLSRDTAASVASEMVDDLALSPADAADIAAAIRDEIAALSSDLEAAVSMNLEAAGEALQAGILHSAASAAGNEAFGVGDDHGEGAGGGDASAGDGDASAGGGGQAPGQAPDAAPGGPAAPPTAALTTTPLAAAPPAAAGPLLTLQTRPGGAMEARSPRSREVAPAPPQRSAPPQRTEGRDPAPGGILRASPSLARASPPPLVVRRSTSYDVGAGLAAAQSDGSESGASTPHLGAPAPGPASRARSELAAAARAAVLSSSASAEGLALNAAGVAPESSLSPRRSAPSLGFPPRPPPLHALFEALREGGVELGPGSSSQEHSLGSSVTSPPAFPAGDAVAAAPLASVVLGSPPATARLPPSPHQGGAPQAGASISPSAGEVAQKPSPRPAASRGAAAPAPGETEVWRVSTDLARRWGNPRRASETDLGAMFSDPTAFGSVQSGDGGAGAGSGSVAGGASPPSADAARAAAALDLAAPARPVPDPASSAFSAEAFGVAACWGGSGNGVGAAARPAPAVGVDEAGLGAPLVASALVTASAPVSGVVSREASPQRADASASPTKSVAGCLLEGTRKLSSLVPRDKETLRRAAADAMKAVELRSLNLLEGGVLGGGARLVRGTPMAACRPVPAGAGGAMNLVAAASRPGSAPGSEVLGRDL
uniref:non-specific serine/threonine protein kinase n=2 Tax=Auxenochlorella protothecoides TaxID=3075 RepID=A0A1D1ZU48_AUXPR